MSANKRGRIGGTREGYEVLFADVVEQFAGRAANQRNRSRRQDSGIDDVFHHFVCEPGRRRGRLHENGNTRKKRRRGFFAEAPGREIERVDENRGTFRGHEKMLAREYTGL